MEKPELKIQFKTAIKAKPEKIYHFITTPEGWDSWFTNGMKFKLEKNSEIQFSWKDWGPDKVSESERAVLLDFVPNKSLTFNWNFFLPEGPTKVRITITPRESDSVVEVIQTGFHHSKAGLNMLTQCSAGWGEALTLLKIYIEHEISFNRK